MTKELSKREKVLIIILALIIIAVAYLKLIYEPTMADISSLNSRKQSEQTEIEARMPKIAKIKSMKEELEILKADKNAETIPLFDNSKEIMNTISAIMKDADEYNIVFQQDKTNGYIIEHPIRLTYSADNYVTARNIYDTLDQQTFVNQISDLQISKDTKSESDYTTVSMLITFFDIKS